MNNHWLAAKQKKQLEDLHIALMEAWGEGLTIQEFIRSIPSKEYQFWMSMKIDCSSLVNGEIGLTLKKP